MALLIAVGADAGLQEIPPNAQGRFTTRRVRQLLNCERVEGIALTDARRFLLFAEDSAGRVLNEHATALAQLDHSLGAYDWILGPALLLSAEEMGADPDVEFGPGDPA